jgi:hypothetical protein
MSAREVIVETPSWEVDLLLRGIERESEEERG